MSWNSSIARIACGLSTLWASAAPADSWPECFAAAGTYYNVAPEVLTAIAVQESGMEASAVHRNVDGSLDLGLMQVNERWLAALMPAGIGETQLLDPCTSIWVGAWILAQSVARHGYTWEAIGAYNAGSRASAVARRAAYAERIQRRLQARGP